MSSPAIMVTRFLTAVLAVHPLVWAALYILLQAYLYFSPFIHGTSGSFYFVVSDPELFSRDLVRTSTLGTATAFYPLIHALLGDQMTNPFYLFIPYGVTCLLVGFGLYKVGRLVGGENQTVGFLMLVLLLVEKSPFTGYLSITRPDYNYQHFTLPILIFAIYFLLKEKNFLFALLMVLAFYFHVRTTLAIGLATVPLIVDRILKRPVNLLSFCLPALLLLPKVIGLLQGFYGQSGFTAEERTDYLHQMMLREQEEGSMYFNEAGTIELMVYTLLAAVGIGLARRIADRKLRRSVYLCHAGVYFAFFVGIVLRILDHFWRPLGEIVMIGYGRACVLGTLLAMATLSLYFYEKFEKYLSRQAWGYLGIFLALMWFLSMNNLYVKSLQDLLRDWVSLKMFAKIVISAGAACVLIFILKKWPAAMPTARQLVVGLLIIAVGYVGAKIPGRAYKSYKIEYPYFPLIPDFSLMPSANLYQAGAWVRQNTAKEDLFVVIEKDGKSEGDFCPGAIRAIFQRSIWCQDLTAAYGNAEAFREWRHRRDTLKKYFGRPFEEWKPLLLEEKIDYVVAQRSLPWPNENNIVFENDTFVVYDIKQLRKTAQLPKRP